MAGAHSTGIDALRGLAVLLVWCHHLFAYTRIELPLVGHLGGLLGVQLFFVVSGYLIVRSAAAYPLRTYVVRRAFRIFPAYWVAVLVVTALSPRVSLESLRADPLAFLVNLFALAHAWPPALQRFDVTTVSWTLTVELAWYALAPLLVALAPKLTVLAARLPALAPAGPDRAGWSVIAMLALAGSTAWVLAAQAGQLDPLFAPGIAAAGVAPVDGFMRFAYIVNAAPAHLVFFAFGALALKFEPQAVRLPGWLLALAVLVFVPLADRWNAWIGVHPSFASGIGLTALFVLVCRHRGDARPGWLASLGRISYPVYLIHVPVLLACVTLVSDRLQAPMWAAAAAAAAATLGLSTLLHHGVEQPGIAFGKALTRT